ncbi:MAG: KEOPS complex subunit Cgi121 [Candidatus Micrarchaeota archaeon]
MLILKINLKMPIDDAIKAITSFNAVLVNIGLVHSTKEIELADYLTKKSFKEKTNIAKDSKLEFLLWLSGKKDIKSAMATIKPTEKEAILIIFNKEEDKDQILNKLEAKEEVFKEKEVDQKRLERISLSRIN